MRPHIGRGISFIQFDPTIFVDWKFENWRKLGKKELMKAENKRSNNRKKKGNEKEEEVRGATNPKEVGRMAAGHLRTLLNR